MSGDSRVTLGAGGAGQVAAGGKTIDANSVKAGDFSEGRSVGNQEVFLTRAGAAALDEFSKMDEAMISTERDPSSFLDAMRMGPQHALDYLLVTQQHSGSTR
jgi:hypothetical protein